MLFAVLSYEVHHLASFSGLQTVKVWKIGKIAKKNSREGQICRSFITCSCDQVDNDDNVDDDEKYRRCWFCSCCLWTDFSTFSKRRPRRPLCSTKKPRPISTKVGWYLHLQNQLSTWNIAIERYRPSWQWWHYFLVFFLFLHFFSCRFRAVD